MKDKIRIIPLTREIAEVIVKGEREQDWENASMNKYEFALSGCGGRVCRCSGGAF